MCANCDPFDTNIDVSGPAQLRHIAETIQDALAEGMLVPAEDRAAKVATPFAELDLGETLPDILDYEFRCAACGSRFGLSVETYHGQGGSWSKR